MVTWTSNNYLLDLKQACGVSSANQQELVYSWSPPPQGLYKANVDRALFASSKHGGICRICVVSRNHKGQVMAAFSAVVDNIQEAQIIEALAMRRATLLAVETSFPNVIFERFYLYY